MLCYEQTHGQQWATRLRRETRPDINSVYDGFSVSTFPSNFPV